MAREAVDMEISALTKKGQGKVDKRVVAIEHTHTPSVSRADALLWSHAKGCWFKEGRQLES